MREETYKGMYFAINREKNKYENIIEFVEQNGLDEMFEDMYGRPIRDYIEIFGLQYHNDGISSEIMLGLCEGGLPAPKKVKVLPDHSLEIRW
ncbi:MAG TPA: hypothetical protein VMB78_02410 [Dissulfurispiraceae bacterium]|nr:hypothetical protein [Dissulfurispiraceae bacterium]